MEKTMSVDPIEQLRRETYEIIYRNKMRKLAREENKKMRQVMGYNVSTSDVRHSPIYECLQDMGEATINDISVRTGLKKKEVHSHLMKLHKLDMAKHKIRSRLPTVWMLK